MIREPVETLDRQHHLHQLTSCVQRSLVLIVEEVLGVPILQTDAAALLVLGGGKRSPPLLRHRDCLSTRSPKISMFDVSG